MLTNACGTRMVSLRGDVAIEAVLALPDPHHLADEMPLPGSAVGSLTITDVGQPGSDDRSVTLNNCPMKPSPTAI